MSCSGTVSRYDRKRGFGFIAPSDGGKTVFVHWQNISSDDKWPCLKRDMEVTFDKESDEKDPNKEIARNVCDASGGSISVGESEEHKLSDFTVKGTVKFFAKKGFGFITSQSKITWPKKLPAGTDVYVSREDLVCEDGTVCALREGMKVQFKVFKREGNDGIAAAEVCQEDGSPLSIEAREPGEHTGKPKGRSKGKAKGKSSLKGKGSAKGVRTVTKTVFVKVPVASFGKGKAFSKGKGKGKGKATTWF